MLREEACAAVAAAARAAQEVAAVAPERVGSGSARAGYSAVPQAEGHCAAVAQDDSSEDEAAQAGCSADSGGYSVVAQADDSLPGDCSAAQADSAVASGGYLVVARADDLLPGDCSAVPVDSAALMADDSAVRERPHPDVRSGLADFLDGSPVG